MLTKSLQDYIEFIYNKLSLKKELKAVDIANHFGVARASVSEALIKLCEKGLIIYEGRKGIIITPEGILEAKKIIEKHNVLNAFFKDILGFEDEISSSNACKIEHVIDKELIDKIKDFTLYCKKNEIDKDFKNNNKEKYD